MRISQGAARSLVWLSLLLFPAASPAHQASAGATAPIERRAPADPDLDVASDLIGQALFLRCFCAEDTLTFSAAGEPELRTRVRPVDWTLAGVNIQKAERRSPGEIELEGVRVAVRYAADRHEWERHPQKTEPMRITVQDAGEPAAFRRALALVFSIGIDRALQRGLGHRVSDSAAGSLHAAAGWRHAARG